MSKIVSIFSLVLVLMLAACATVNSLPPTVSPSLVVVTATPVPSTTIPATTQPEPLFFARPQGNHGPAIAYSRNTGAQQFTLPAGLFSADGLHYFGLTTAGDQSTLNAYDPANGQRLFSLNLSGAWNLSYVTADGAHVVLAQQAKDQPQLTALILSGSTGQEQQRVTLPGNLDVDALSTDGAWLYIIEYLPTANPDHYQVRAYDTAMQKLLPDPLFDKREPDEEMEGERLESVSSKGGQWLLSLYVRMKEDEAFVHALNATDRYAFCIDLPAGGGDLSQQKFNTLALAPQGMVLYIANAVTGTVAEANLQDFSVTRVTTFKGESAPADLQGSVVARSLLSSDGQTLYFTSGQNVWRYDTLQRTVTGPFETSGQISGLGLNPAGDRLLVAKMDGSLAALDTTSGLAVSLR